ncbi:MAG: T9SS type A sorting domain-containing protein [Bacteroidetes bacterium]|nr:T9SS type A sorting domain-containing protein [Bacteroidota bacterium]
MSAPFQNDHFSGLGVWTGDVMSGIAGGWEASRLYDRWGYGDASKYSLNYVNQPTVAGGLFAGPYSGHVAIGTRFFLTGNPSIRHVETWTTIINPTSRNAVWDHIIKMGADDEDGECEGVSAVRDEGNITDFFVVSKVTDYTPADNNSVRVGITRYTSNGASILHQVDWMQQYAYPDYNLIPVSIVQNYYGNVTVIGNMVSNTGGASGIFAFTVDQTTGAVVSPLYHFTGGAYYDNLEANSATNHNGSYDEIVIAGKAIPDGQGYTLPMIMTLYPSGALYSCGIYRYKNASTDNNYLTGQFNNAKMFFEGPNYYDYRLVAVGDIGDQGTYPGVSSAIAMRATNSFATPLWTYTQGANLVNSGSTAATSAKWVVEEPDRINTPADPAVGEYVYIGTQRSNGITTNLNIASGGLDKQTGGSECTVEPYFVSNEQVLNQEELEIEASEWTTDEELRTETNSVTYNHYYCSGSSTINAGKISEEEKSTVKPNEQAEISLRYDNIIISYTNKEENTITITVSDVLGNILIKKNTPCPSGSRTIELNAKELRTGTYFVSLVSPTARYNKNIVIIK